MLVSTDYWPLMLLRIFMWMTALTLPQLLQPYSGDGQRKAIIGLCCLTLPAAFAEVRLTLALVGLLGLPDNEVDVFQKPGLIVVCVALGTGTYRVAQCYVKIRHLQDVEASSHGLGPLGDISGEVFGPNGVRCALIAILAAQFGLAVAYTDVIVPTVMKMCGLTKLTVQLWVFGVSGVMSFIKEMKGLAWLSIVALVAFMYIAVALLHFGIVEIQAGRDSFADSWMPLRFAGRYFRVVVSQYAFADMQLQDPAPFKRRQREIQGEEKVGAGLPQAHDHLKAKEDGCFGFGVYGDGVSEIIYESFPADSLDVQLCKVTVCIVQLINFQVQMYPLFMVGD
ncbi:unnamed protein product, partial [Symbiodinium pilosum]